MTNLSISDLDVILSRLKDFNQRIWYKAEMNPESVTDEEKAELLKNSRLIRDVEDEINARIFNLK